MARFDNFDVPTIASVIWLILPSGPWFKMQLTIICQNFT